MVCPAHPIDRNGLTLHERINVYEPIHWQQENYIEEPLPTFQGVAQGITTVRSGSNATGYKDAGIGDTVFAGIATGRDSYIHIVVEEWFAALRHRKVLTYYGHISALDGAILKTSHRWRGIPGMIQGAFGYTERGPWPWSPNAHYGNVELVAPCSDGGIDHFWHECGGLFDVNEWNTHWHGPHHFGSKTYDAVSIMQSSYKIRGNGVLEVVARWFGQRGFDYFWRDDAGKWSDPVHVGQ